MLAKSTLVAILAAAIAVAFSPLPELRAAPFGGSGSPTGSGGLVQSVQAEKKEPEKKKASKKKASKKKGKRKKGRKAGKGGSCGTYMYRKGGKCLDARNKK